MAECTAAGNKEAEGKPMIRSEASAWDSMMMMISLEADLAVAWAAWAAE